MKLIVIILTACILTASFAGLAQTTVSFSGKNVELKKVFVAIKQQTGYGVFWNTDMQKIARPVSLDARNMPLAAFLDLLLKDQPFNYEISRKNIILSNKISGDDKKLGDDELGKGFTIDVKGRV